MFKNLNDHNIRSYAKNVLRTLTKIIQELQDIKIFKNKEQASHKIR